MFLLETYAVRCIITGLSECGENFFLTNLILNILNEHEKVYIYSPSLQPDFYQKFSKFLTMYTIIHENK